MYQTGHTMQNLPYQDDTETHKKGFGIFHFEIQTVLTKSINL